MNSTDQLIEKAVAGNTEAKAIVLKKLHRDLKRLARGLLAREYHNHSFQTDDLINTWYRRFNWEGLQGGRTAMMKLTRVAMRHILFDRARKRRVRPQELVCELDSFPKEQDLSFKLILKHELKKLDVIERKIINLKIKGYTVDEIAKALGMDRNRVQRMFKETLLHLKSKLR